MKIKLTLLLLFVGSVFLNSQDYYEYLFSKAKNIKFHASTIEGDYIYLGGQRRACDIPYITKMDEMGNIIWERLPAGSYGRVRDLLTDKNQKIVGTIQWKIADDVESSEDGFYFVKYDASGTLINLVQHSYIDPNESLPLSIIDHPIHGYLVAASNKIIRLNQIGQYLNQTTFLLADEITHLESYQDSSYLSSQVFDYFEYRIFLHNAEGTKLDSITIPHKVNDISTNQEVININTNGGIYAWTPMLDSLELIEVPGIASVLGSGYYADNLYAWGLSLFGTNFIAARQSDQTWEELINKPNDLKLNHIGILKERDFYLSGLIRHESVGFSPFYVPSLKTSFVQFFPDFDQPEPADLDIALTSVIPEPEPEISILNDTGSGQVYASIKTTLNIEITNVGSEIVNYLALSEELAFTQNCFEERTYRQFSNLQLAPGATFNTTMEIRRYRYLTLGDPVEIEACVFVLAPNRKFDTDPSNDISCGLFITDVNEQLSDQGIKVYPNPSSDILQIETASDNLIQAYELYDLTGRLVLSNSVENQKKTTIQLAPFPSGIYWIKVQTKDGWTSKKVIVD